MSQVPVIRTPITMRDYAIAVVRAWLPDFGMLSPAAAGVLWAQYMIETGGHACWNFNLGNVKHAEGDGFDWIALAGVFEYVNGERVNLSVTDPGSRFRAYPDLPTAMRQHLAFLRSHRYASAWPFVLTGDVTGFARELRRVGYFTASAEAYAAGMMAPFEAFLNSTHYFSAVEAKAAEDCAVMLDEAEADTEPGA